MGTVPKRQTNSSELIRYCLINLARLTTKTHRSIGQSFEKRARQFLEQRQLKTIACNYTKHVGVQVGEIDLIMRDGQTLVFVEVRYRKHPAYLAIESVDWKKQKKIIQTAQHYIADNRYRGSVRFDVVCFDGSNAQAQWFKNAFAPEESNDGPYMV